MKSKTKCLLFLIIFSTIFVFLSINYNDLQIKDVGKDNNNFTSEKQPNNSASWNLGAIIIDDDGTGTHTWSEAVSAGWCSGNGDWNTPYVVENVSFSFDMASGSGLTIRDSNKYFIVRKCNAINVSDDGSWDAGIKLLNTSNGMLTENNCSINDQHGIILFQECTNNTIINNVADNNFVYGIFLQSNSNNNTVTENKAHFNSFGIGTANSKDNTIFSNIAEYNFGYGIELKKSKFTSITKNEFKNNGYGVRIENSHNNTVAENNVGGNYNGIVIVECDNNTIFKNNAIYSRDNGILMGNSNYNKITENVMTVWQRFSGIHLDNCNFNFISNNNVSSDGEYGIELELSSNNMISDNNIKNCTWDGMILDSSSNNNNITGNVLENCGIYVNGDANNILGNIFNYGWRGIYLRASGNKIIGNFFNENFYGGIQIHSGNDVIISGNTFEKCGLRFYQGSYSHVANYDIDTTNLANGKPIYFYTDVHAGALSFFNAGQIIMFNCTYAIPTSLDVSHSTCGIFLHECENISLRNINSSNNYWGFHLVNSHYNYIHEGTANHNIEEGILLVGCNNNTIWKTSASYNYVGVGMQGPYLDYAYNNTIRNSTLSYNYRYGLRMSWCSNSTIWANNFTCNAIDHIRESDCLGSDFKDNYFGECPEPPPPPPPPPPPSNGDDIIGGYDIVIFIGILGIISILPFKKYRKYKKNSER